MISVEPKSSDAALPSRDTSTLSTKDHQDVLDVQRWASDLHDAAGHTYGKSPCGAPLPYNHHLAAVSVALQFAGCEDAVTLKAGACHDLIEMRAATFEQISEQCGEDAAFAVSLLTQHERESRRERLERLCILTHVRHEPYSAAQVLVAVRVVLADRIANVRACWASRDHRLFMYHREHKLVRRMAKPLMHDPVVASLVGALVDLLGEP